MDRLKVLGVGFVWLFQEAPYFYLRLRGFDNHGEIFLQEDGIRHGYQFPLLILWMIPLELL